VNAGYSEPILVGEEVTVTDASGTVYFLNRATGSVNGVVKGGGPCLDSSAVCGPAGSLIIGTTAGEVRIFDPRASRFPNRDGAGPVRREGDATGGAVVPLGDGFLFAGIAVSGERAYVCTMNGDVYALNLAGALKLSE